MALNELYVLDSNFKKLWVIDNAKSVIWTSRYSECGDFEICLPMKKGVFNYIDPNFEETDFDRYIVHDDSEMIGVIEGYEITTADDDIDYLIITGRCATSILSRRIIRKVAYYENETTAINVLNSLISNNGGSATGDYHVLENLHISSSVEYLKNPTNDKIYSANYEYQNLYKSVVDICNHFDYGIRSKFEYVNEQKKIWIEFYQGTDRSHKQTENPIVTFSTEYNNLHNTKYSVSYKDYANLVVIEGGKYKEAERNVSKPVFKKNRSGMKLREKFVAAHDLPTVNPTTKTNYELNVYEQMLENRGLEELSKASITKAVTGEVGVNNLYKYNVDYYLGDIVTIENNYGFKEAFRLTEMVESWDENGYTLVPTFRNMNMT